MFHCSQLVVNWVFFKCRERCLQSWLGSVVVSRIVMVHQQNIKEDLSNQLRTCKGPRGSKPGQPTQQSQVATKGQQHQSRGQPTSCLVVESEQARPSRPLIFTLTLMKQFNPQQLPLPQVKKVNTAYQDSQDSFLRIYHQC